MNFAYWGLPEAYTRLCNEKTVALAFEFEVDEVNLVSLACGMGLR